MCGKHGARRHGVDKRSKSEADLEQSSSDPSKTFSECCEKASDRDVSVENVEISA